MKGSEKMSMYRQRLVNKTLMCYPVIHYRNRLPIGCSAYISKQNNYSTLSCYFSTNLYKEKALIKHPLRKLGYGHNYLTFKQLFECNTLRGIYIYSSFAGHCLSG